MKDKEEGKMALKYVYFFGGAKAEGKAELNGILGGKGANLAEMSNMGVPVPPGFTITTEACKHYFEHDRRCPEELVSQVEDGIGNIENLVGAKFGDEKDPLLLSVRSGARVSMPGMMDTILNLGLNELTRDGLAEKTRDKRFAFDSCQRFVRMYGEIVMGIEKGAFDKVLEEKKVEKGVRLDTELTAEDLEHVAERMKKQMKEVSGKEFPSEPREQLWAAISAVFESWNNPRAIAYRQANRIPDTWGTAVDVQAMVFGNMGGDSGSGVVFSRNPSTGEKELWGEFLPNAQGEDVVAGIRTPQPISDLAKTFPHCYQELVEVSQKLERHFKQLQDIEFTIQEGKLWILQTRAAKRTAQAALKIAMDMVRERLISGKEIFRSIEAKELEQLLHPVLDPNIEKEVIARGLPASPGVASGKVIFDPAELVELTSKNGHFILVRPETSADDVPGMRTAAGVLTARGGITSHAAVVARGMGRCAVVGCNEINIDLEREEFRVGNRIFRKGDFITLDGSKGEVIAGKLPVVPPKLGEDFKELMIWTDMVKTQGVRANADNPQDARLAKEFGAEGIGLCRTEHMFFQPDRINLFRQVILGDTAEERKEVLAKLLLVQRNDFLAIFRGMEGLPVTVRLLDPPLHEFLPLPYAEDELKSLARRLSLPFGNLKEKVQSLREFNPMLGHRGCRLGITFPEIYQMQVRAEMEAASELTKQGFSISLEVMLPFIGHADEVKFLKGLIIDTCEQVKRESGVRSLDYRIGVMIELPRAALTAHEIAPLVDFFSFGTNDLTQATLGLSRDDAGTFLPLYLENKIFQHDPFVTLDETGVGELIKIAVERGKKANPDLEVGICGEHGGDPASIRFFHHTGLDYVSCSPYRVPIARFAASQAAVTDED